MNDFNFARTAQANPGAMDASVDLGLRKFMLSVYNKMALGLVITAILAYVVGSSPELMALVFGTPLRWVVMFGPIGILLVSAFAMKNPSPVAANLIYWSVATLIGVSMGALVFVYAGRPDGFALIAKAFMTTAVAFGGLSLWGYTTKKDLTGWGTFLIMGVIGLIVASLLNMFFGGGNPIFSTIISVVGVLIFAGLTAYDTQRLKFQYYELGGNDRAIAVASTFGALSLYLNFINMFQFILALMSGGDD